MFNAPLEIGFFEHPKLHALMDKLDNERSAACIGYCARLWGYAMQHEVGGHDPLPDMADLTWARVFDVDRAEGLRIRDAMVAVKLLDFTDGRYRIHNWHKRGGKYVDRMLGNRERDRTRRATPRDAQRNPDGCHMDAARIPTGVPMESHGSPSVQSNPNQTKPNQTKPNQTKPNQTKPRASLSSRERESAPTPTPNPALENPDADADKFLSLLPKSSKYRLRGGAKPSGVVHWFRAATKPQRILAIEFAERFAAWAETVPRERLDGLAGPVTLLNDGWTIEAVVEHCRPMAANRDDPAARLLPGNIPPPTPPSPVKPKWAIWWDGLAPPERARRYAEFARLPPDCSRVKQVAAMTGAQLNQPMEFKHGEGRLVADLYEQTQKEQAA